MIYKTIEPHEVKAGNRIFYREALHRVSEVFAGGTEGGVFVMFDGGNAAHLSDPVDVVDEARTQALLARYD